MGGQKQEPKQKTNKGLEIPVPKRQDVLRDLRKGARISGPRRPKK